MGKRLEQTPHQRMYTDSKQAHEETPTSYIQPLWDTAWQFLAKLNILLPRNPAITLLGVHPNELKTYVHTKTCTQIFIAALFTIVKTWKPSKCS